MEARATALALADFDDEVYAAGLLEGALTCKEMVMYNTNANAVNFADGPFSDELKHYLATQDKYIRAKAAHLKDVSEYWHAVAASLAQMDGMFEGQNRFCPNQRLSYEDLLHLQNYGDLIDLKSAFPSKNASSALPHTQDIVEVAAALYSTPPNHPSKRPKTRCSALFKMLPNKTDIMFGHDTWDSYGLAAPRLFKSYVLPVLRGGRIEMHHTVFSSSPSYIASTDDFYMVSGTSQLAVIETSLNINDKAAYKNLKPHTVPCWLRSVTANKLAHDAGDWTYLFSQEHSGTYNSQWMVLNIPYFESVKDLSDEEAALPDGTFWVLEEVPGAIISSDMTGHLRDHKYWASYNIAYFEETRRIAGDTANWHNDTRALLFRDMQSDVKTLSDMQAVMGWNDYLNSNVSKGNPENAVMSRADLPNSPSFSAFGGIDSKVSSVKYYRAGRTAFGRVGPTWDAVPVFCWHQHPELAQNNTHEGHPECFNYLWQEVKPSLHNEDKHATSNKDHPTVIFV